MSYLNIFLLTPTLARRLDTLRILFLIAKSDPSLLLFFSAVIVPTFPNTGVRTKPLPGQSSTLTWSYLPALDQSRLDWRARGESTIH
jgi:hypothetical protein